MRPFAKLPRNALVAREKIVDYLLVRQASNDKSLFLAKAGFTAKNPNDLLRMLRSLRNDAPAMFMMENEWGQYYRVSAIVCGPSGQAIGIDTIWMRERLSGQTKFITLIPAESSDL